MQAIEYRPAAPRELPASATAESVEIQQQLKQAAPLVPAIRGNGPEVLLSAMEAASAAAALFQQRPDLLRPMHAALARYREHDRLVRVRLAAPVCLYVRCERRGTSSDAASVGCQRSDPLGCP